MKRNIVVYFMAAVVVFGLGAGVLAQEIVWDEISRGSLDVGAILLDSNQPRSIYFGSKKGIFKSEDAGASWRNVLYLSGQNNAVNYLVFAPQDKNSIYAATANGLFYSTDKGEHWKRIFKAKSYPENECTTLAVLPFGIYLGTKGGLFVSKDMGRSWHKETGRLGNSHILTIAYSRNELNYIYIASLEGVFKTENGGQAWENIFNAYSVGNASDTPEQLEDSDEEKRFSSIRCIAVDPQKPNHLYLATAKGLYESKDRGQTWEPLSSYGLLTSDAKLIFFSYEFELYAVTKSGIFKYKNFRWEETSLGLAANEINFLDSDNEHNLYAACDKGLFKAKIDGLVHEIKKSSVAAYYKDEPKINEVQEAAIKYAEVEPQKIMRWRKQAAKKAWFPNVSVGLDRNTTDLWHWEGGSTTKTDDDNLRRGKDTLDWDIALSWDLSKLIYNDDQTSIDVRSRLMVELRADILDEVTKLYYERIRLKMEIDNLAIEDRKKLLEKELRLDELTSMLDGLTDGYFLKNTKPL